MKKLFTKITAILLVVGCLFCLNFTAGAAVLDEVDALKSGFVFGEGPVVGDYSVDYRYYSPVKENDTTKYPLVVWLHGMGDGSKDGKQIETNNIACWVSEEFQSRFTAGGAFVLAARSREENGIFWDNSMLEPLRAAIEAFVAANKDNVDTTKIYVGGYSMGGKMTFKMAIAYPEMFAAAFPICPAWSPDAQQLEKISDMPIWLISSKKDPLVNYYMGVSRTWEKLCEITTVAENCRFSSLGTVRYPDSKKTASNHHAWYAATYDMFSVSNGDYPEMSTVNALGEEVKLSYPNGLISWLNGFTSDYDGSALEGKGNLEGVKNTDGLFSSDNSIIDIIVGIFRTLASMIFGL